jgi:heme exporter protein A
MLRLFARDLTCIRGFRTVFHGVNFELAGGEALALTGANGSGKSTLLRLIAGLLPAAGGALELDGGAGEASLAEQAHYQGHLDAFKPALTVEENLRFWARYLGIAAASDSALEKVGLDGLAKLPAAYLSAGQRRRLSLARLIAAPRPLWLLDEPTSALDAAGQEMLGVLMRGHLAEGGLIVAATHGPLGIEHAELQLGKPAPSPDSPSKTGVNALTAGEGGGGGSKSVHTSGTPTPNPSPQGGGEQVGARIDLGAQS